MKVFIKKHIGLIIILIIFLVFPTSLSNQAKLNMRIIVTGLAIDKSDEGYEVTAQIVRSSPGNESPGTSATIEFISEDAKTISSALEKLSYKAGKVAAFSHTSFVVLGDDLKDEAKKCLDYFLRDKIVKSNTMVVFAEKKASDEIKKTKEIELSVGLGIQKVYLFKEEESDGIMMSVIDFLKDSETFSKTSVAGVLSLKSADEQGSSGGSSGGSGGSGGDSSGGSGGGSEQSSGSGGSSGGSGGSSGGSSSGGGSGSSGVQYFEPKSPIMCFVDGKYACKIEEDDEFSGYMLANPKTRTSIINVQNIESPNLKDALVAINIKSKNVTKSIRYENGVPCLDIHISITNSELNEVQNSKALIDFTEDEYKALQKALKSQTSSDIAKCFDKTKQSGVDIFGAYENAYKFSYGETSRFKTPQEFLEKLKLNVDVDIKKLDF